MRFRHFGIVSTRFLIRFNIVSPWFRQLLSRFRPQPYNAPVHTAKDVQKWLKTNKIKILKNWPSQSPDLNPIEHLWHELETRIRNRPNNLKNLKELEAALKEEWNKIPQNVLMNLIESMPSRIQACIKSKGYPTKY